MQQSTKDLNTIGILLYKRKRMLKKHFNGENEMDFLHIPEEKEWYGKNIFPIDVTVIAAAHRIARDHNLHYRFKNIYELLENKPFLNYCNLLLEVSKEQ